MYNGKNTRKKLVFSFQCLPNKKMLFILYNRSIYALLFIEIHIQKKSLYNVINDRKKKTSAERIQSIEWNVHTNTQICISIGHFI